LAKSQSLSVMSYVAGSLDAVETDIDNSQSQVANLTDQAARPYVTIHLTTQLSPPPVADESFGARLHAAFQRSWTGTKAFLSGAMVVLSALAPPVVLAAVVTGIILLIVFFDKQRKRRRKGDGDDAPSKE